MNNKRVKRGLKLWLAGTIRLQRLRKSGNKMVEQDGILRQAADQIDSDEIQPSIADLS